MNIQLHEISKMQFEFVQLQVAQHQHLTHW